MALATPELDVVGITTVAGNVPQPQVTQNALAIVELAGAETPVFAGSRRPILRPLYTAEYVHGPTGIDGAEFPAPRRPASPQHAVDFIIEACTTRDDVSLVAIGPLTNVALAVVTEPDIAARIAEVVWMGGAFFAGGNTTPAAEFNAYVDPHAAAIVAGAGVPLTIFPLDVTHQALVLPDHLTRIRAIGTPVADAVAGMLAFYERWDVDKYGFPGAPLHDPCTIAYLLRPGLFGGRQVNVEVETSSETTMGALVVDWWGVTGKPPNAMVMKDVDAGGFMDLVIELIGGL